MSLYSTQIFQKQYIINFLSIKSEHAAELELSKNIGSAFVFCLNTHGLASLKVIRVGDLLSTFIGSSH